MFEKTFRVPYYGLDLGGRMKTGLLLECFQEAADLHAGLMKMSVEDLRREGMTWVLRRYRIRVAHYPGREELTVRTWHEPHRNLHSLRVFEALDASGRAFASAWSSWILLDLERGRPLRLDRAASREYYDMAAPTGEGPQSPLPAPPDTPSDAESAFRVRWQELDANGHANHTAYYNWALETVPDELRPAHRPTELDAEFLHSVMREDVLVQTHRDPDDPLRFIHTVAARDSGQTAAKLMSVWR